MRPRPLTVEEEFPILLFPKQVHVDLAQAFKLPWPPIIRTNTETQQQGEAELRRRFPNG